MDLKLIFYICTSLLCGNIIANGTTENLNTPTISIKSNKLTFDGKTYRVITVKGNDINGTRQKNVAVDIGYGSRRYWGLTNEYGQLVYVLAGRITIQDESKEKVNSKGRYYNEEANVPGTELPDYDQGHIIADSLGGVANAYNITPQNSKLNRHGNQAYMEKNIREAQKCTCFIATITYPNNFTQIPSYYKYEYLLNDTLIVDEFANEEPRPPIKINDINSVDTNRNGRVTIKEAKAAGYSMPISSSHWLYPYMDDKDGDGYVGEKK